MERRRAPEFVPTIIVNDGPVTPPSAGLSATVVTLGHADCGPAPDIRFVQTSDSTVRITSGASILEVAIVAFRQEQAWTGVGVVESRPIDDYTDTVGPARAMTKGIDGTQSDDRVAAAVGILTASSADPTPLRLPLGDHAVDAVLDHLRTVEAEIRQWEPVSTPPSATKEKDWNPPRNELR